MYNACGRLLYYEQTAVGSCFYGLLTIWSSKTPLRDFFTISGASALACIDMHIARLIGAEKVISWRSSFSDEMLVFCCGRCDPKINEADAECKSTVYLSVVDVPRTRQLINDVPTDMSTARFSPTRKPVETGISSIWAIRGMTPKTDISFFSICLYFWLLHLWNTFSQSCS